MKKENAKKIIDELILTFLRAGKTSIDLRKKGLIKKIKSDNTPVTNADIEVNNILTKKINQLTPDIPIISEETSLNKEVKNLKNFWLIDPIDGTNDYINNREEFTLNASLVINNEPQIALVNAPDKNRLFYTYGKDFCFELRNEKKIKLECKKLTNEGEIKALSYSENLKPEILNIHKKYGVTECIKMKSSLKFCVIASGEYDLYVAEPRACEWDIAAGHAILKNAGGQITDFDGNEILYGKENFKNPSIILKRASIL